MNEQRYIAEQIDGRPEDDLSNRWSVIDAATGEVVASWEDTPITGMTEAEAREFADAENERA